jgi:hypothetical protein
LRIFSRANLQETTQIFKKSFICVSAAGIKFALLLPKRHL